MELVKAVMAAYSDNKDIARNEGEIKNNLNNFSISFNAWLRSRSKL